ncbi:MAG: DUF4124 domain-containing protein [Motiliproteus sp.]
MRNRAVQRPLIALALMVGLSTPVMATDVYRWIDENGVPSYGERPPEGVSFVKLKLNGSRSSTTSSLPPPFPVTPRSSTRAPETQDKSQQQKANSTSTKKATP